jgi:ribosomal protein S18 acetylase RimI-like enzyme
MNVQIRMISENDLFSFHKCLDSVAREGKFLAREKAPDIEDIEKRIKHEITTNQAHFVAVLEDQVVGWCDALRYQVNSLNHRAGIGMGVQKDYRGNKIGEKLLLATIEHSRQTGIKRIDLDVREDNTPAINLYKKCGFVVYARMKKGIFLEGRFFDLISMEYLL